jgi:hypothetical protein
MTGWMNLTPIHHLVFQFFPSCSKAIASLMRDVEACKITATFNSFPVAAKQLFY